MSKLRSPLVAIFLIVLVDILGLTIILPLLPFYAEKYGGGPAIYGVLVASFALCQLISGPLLGHISDRTGRKPLLLVSQVGTLVGFVILAFAQSIGMIFLSRIIDGLTAGNLSLAQAYISDVTEPKNRAKAFGIIGISFGIGFLIGPALSGFLSQYGYQYPPLAAAGLSFLSIMGTTFLLPPVPRTTENTSTQQTTSLGGALFHFKNYVPFFQNAETRRYLIQFFCFAFSFSMFVSGFALFCERRFTFHDHPFGPKEVGYLFAYSGLLGILIQGGLIGRLVKKLGEPKMVLLGFLSMALGYGLLSFPRAIPFLLVVMAIASFGSGVVRPVLTSVITQAASRKEQGVILGLNQSLNSIAQIIAPLISGFLISGGFLALWPWATAFTAMIALCLTRLQPKNSDRSLTEPASVP